MNKRNWILSITGAAVVLAAGLFFLLNSSSSGRSFVADLMGSSEVPPVNTAASGQATFQLSPDGTSMTFTLTVANISNVVASHIHSPAPVGVNAPVVVPLFAGSMPGPFSGVLSQGTITQASLQGSLLGQPLSVLIAQIDAGIAYVNVHTTQNPGGEIRGQLRAAP